MYPPRTRTYPMPPGRTFVDLERAPMCEAAAQADRAQQVADAEFWDRFDPELAARRNAMLTRAAGMAETDVALDRARRAIPIEVERQGELERGAAQTFFDPAVGSRRRQLLADETARLRERYVEPRVAEGEWRIPYAQTQATPGMGRNEAMMRSAAMAALGRMAEAQAYRGQDVDALRQYFQQQGAAPGTQPPQGGPYEGVVMSRQEFETYLRATGLNPDEDMQRLRLSGISGHVPTRAESSHTMDVRIFVGNLNKSTTQYEINTLFATAGTVSSVEVAMDKGTGKSKGFAFVSMPTQEEADKAISMFNDYALAQNKLEVNVAKPRTL